MKIIIEKITKVNEKEVLELKKYNYIGDFHEGLAWFWVNDKYGFINKEGKEVVKAKYDDVGDFHEGLARFCLNDKYGFINKEGKETVKAKYDNLGDFHEGLAWFWVNDKYGFINKEGKEVVKAKYDDVGDFHEGLARFRLNGKYGFINKEGKETVKAKYDDVGDFHEGLAVVSLNGKYGLINKNGEEIADICFDNIEIFDGIIIFDSKYIVQIDDLSFEYECVLKNKDNVRIMKFDTIEQRNEFYNYITHKKDVEEIMLSDLEEQMKKELLNKENKSYSDILISAEKEYAKIMKMD